MVSATLADDSMSLAPDFCGSRGTMGRDTCSSGMPQVGVGPPLHDKLSGHLAYLMILEPAEEGGGSLRLTTAFDVTFPCSELCLCEPISRRAYMSCEMYDIYEYKNSDIAVYYSSQVRAKPLPPYPICQNDQGTPFVSHPSSSQLAAQPSGHPVAIRLSIALTSGDRVGCPSKNGLHARHFLNKPVSCECQDSLGWQFSALSYHTVSLQR